MGATDKLLINFSKQSRKQNPSARPGQLAMIRGADPGQTDDHFHARRCIAKNDNLVLGYRQGQEAGRMDSEQKVQNGRGASCVGDCCGSGHSLMSLVPFVVLAIMLILPQCAALDPCTDRITIDESWRDVSITAVTETNHCDRNTFVENQWYSFRINDKPATIPTTCIKRNMCGAKIAMRVDLNGQSLPKTKGENITASLCGSYDVLGNMTVVC
uniref:ZP domain-containing protein n=1 Tax=Arion vulgaris TaxID=1028688 RepID=A0A0B7BHE2_9EUPU